MMHGMLKMLVSKAMAMLIERGCLWELIGRLAVTEILDICIYLTF